MVNTDWQPDPTDRLSSLTVTYIPAQVSTWKAPSCAVTDMMSSQSARKDPYRFAVIIWASCLAGPILGQRPENLPAEKRPAQAAPAHWLEEADLRGVFFHDTDYGWAVGDLGVVWHTHNGGSIWTRQTTPVDCQLTDVHFYDQNHGWAVGGFARPLTHRSSGVVLHTTDGGKTWEEITGLLVPWLNGVHFVTQKKGYAAGHATALYPSGVFSTTDGGRTWSPLRGVEGAHWAAGHFQDSAGLLVSYAGDVAWLANAQLRRVQKTSRTALWNQTSCALVQPRIGLVGRGQRPLLSVDGGSSWQSVGAFPGDAEANFRFATLAAHDSRCWIAGAPGTRVFRSQDHTRSWQAISTAGLLPIHRLYFTDSDHGWAVGARGRILATNDGGATWHNQRGGGKRAALLGIFSSEQDVPWELLAQASAADEYRVHVVVLGTKYGDPLRCPAEARLAEATMRIGASSEVLTRLQLPTENLSASHMLSDWEKISPRVTDRLISQLVESVRTWRPEIVLTASSDEDARQGLRRLTSRFVVDACELAASDASYPNQRQAGLAPWETSRVVAITAQSAAPTVRSNRSDVYIPALDRRVSDLARQSRRLTHTEPTSAAHSWTLIHLDAHDADKTLRQLGKNPFAGSSLQFDTAARRVRAESTSATTAERQAAQRRWHVRNMLLRGHRLAGGEMAVLEHADRLMATIGHDAAGDILFEMAQQAVKQGKLELAEATFRRLTTRYGDHALSDYALRWLVSYHTSAELRWRIERPQATADVRLVSSDLPESNEGAVTVTSPEVAERETQPWRTGLRLTAELKSKRPDLYAEPAIIFPLAAISRDNQRSQASALYQRQLGLPRRCSWRQRAADELALLDPASPKESLRLWRCVAVDSRPHLDGVLSDDCWKQAARHALGSDPLAADGTSHSSGNPPTEVYLAHDATHLYLAAVCKKQLGVTYLPIRRPRPRDADLTELDRIELQLDVNRDYSSAWTFGFDHRGWTTESVSGDIHWNPAYYVASTADETQWTIEVAIPLSELAPASLQTGVGWAIGLRRVIPGHGVQSWIPAESPPHGPQLGGIMLME